MKLSIYALSLSLAISGVSKADQSRAIVTVNFDQLLQPWDGFGINYVETAQTPDYETDPQDYGGFSLLNEEQRLEIIELVFGSDGLQPGIIKMFLDPFHETTENGTNDNEDPYLMDPEGFDHERSTQWMRYFVQNGIETSRRNGNEIEIITTLYGPPASMSKQKAFRGRDLDPAMREELAEYMVSWIKYLKDNEYPVNYLSLHNEGEDYKRWNADGFTDKAHHDYNLFWPPEQVVDFLKLMPDMFEKHGVEPVALTPGEPSTWLRLTMNPRVPGNRTSYAAAIGTDPDALNNLGLITSHSFWHPTDTGASFLREMNFSWGQQEQLRAWTTSASWKSMSTDFIRAYYDEIYVARVNAVIPWAFIQHHPSWTGGDPNPGSAVKVNDDGTYTVQPGYYFYKQLSRIGQPGTRIAETYSEAEEVKAIAFDDNGTGRGDAFVVINDSDEERVLDLRILGSDHAKFQMYRTSDAGDRYRDLGASKKGKRMTSYRAPAKSVTTFVGQP